jgi:hypothetical protein
MTVAAQMFDTYPKDLGGADRQKLLECIEACFECAQACTYDAQVGTTALESPVSRHRRLGGRRGRPA